MPRPIVAAAIALATAVLASCKGDSAAPTASCSVTAVAVSPSTASIVAGATTSLAANVTQQNCGALSPAWSSGNTAVATVSQTGVVTGVAAGVTTVTAATNGVSGSATVTVTAPPCVVSAITLAPTTAALAPGDTLTIRPTVTQTNCSATTITWSSATPAVATVSPAGLVTAVANGTANISAAIGAITATTAVTVATPTLGSRWTTTQLRLAGSGDAPTGFTNAAWAASATDLFVASNGDLFRYSAGSWRRFTESGFGASALWGSSANDVWGVGARILRWNGTAWTVVAQSNPQELTGIWGSAANDVFAVGRGGTILRYTGTAWTPMASPTTATLTGISGSGSTFALAVSATGQVLRWDGTAWSIAATPASNLRAVWVASPTSAFAVGFEGVYRFDGTNWTQQALPGAGGITPTTVWGSAPNDVYVGGANGYLAHYNGTAWSVVPQETGADVVVLAGTGTLTVAGGSGFVGTLSPSALTMLSYAPTLNAVWAIDRDNAWAVGESGIAWRYAAGQWQRVSTGGFHTLSAVWAASPTQVYAGGTRRDGSGVILRHDGNAWSEVTIPATGSIGALHGPAGGRPVAMSRFSPLLVLDGGTWRTGSPGAPSGDATAMWGTSATDFLVVGTSGYAARYDGTASLVPVASGPSNAHFVTVWGSGPSNYFAGTNNGALHRFDGSAWTPVATASGAAFRLWGPSASLLYTLSFNGEVGRLEGNAWTRLRSAENDLLFYGFHGTATRLFAVGSQGGVMMTP